MTCHDTRFVSETLIYHCMKSDLVFAKLGVHVTFHKYVGIYVAGSVGSNSVSASCVFR